MAYKAITIYTPTGTEPHIAAQDDAFIYDSLLAGNSGLLGSLTCTKQDDNTVVLSGGGVSNSGFIMYVPEGDSCELLIENGAQGLVRHDIIVARFTKGGGETPDQHCFAVIKGIAGSSGEDPAVTDSDLTSFGDIRELALFRVVVDGIGISSIEQIANQAAAPFNNTEDTDFAGTAASAKKLAAARKICVCGDACGSADFDGSADAKVSVSVNAIAGSKVYIQTEEPSDPKEGDLWLSYGS